MPDFSLLFLVHRFAYKLTYIPFYSWNDGPIDSSPAFRSRKERPKGAKKVDGNWRVFVDQCPHRKGEMHAVYMIRHFFLHIVSPSCRFNPSTEEIVCMRMSYVFYCHCLLI